MICSHVTGLLSGPVSGRREGLCVPSPQGPDVPPPAAQAGAQPLPAPLPPPQPGGSAISGSGVLVL